MAKSERVERQFVKNSKKSLNQNYRDNNLWQITKD